MEESKEQQALHRFLQFCIYFSLCLDILIFIYFSKTPLPDVLSSYWIARPLSALSKIVIYTLPLYSRLFTLLLIVLVSIGTLAKKEKELDAKRAIAYPLSIGLILFFCGLYFFRKRGAEVLLLLSWGELGYCFCLLAGTILVHISMDNISKIISAKLGKDRWNIEEESFMQSTKAKHGPYRLCIPMLFYYRKKIHAGFINLENIFRGTLLIGTPGSGKSFSIVMPVIRQLLEKDFCLALYDFKFPDLAQIAYHHFLLKKNRGECHCRTFTY